MQITIDIDGKQHLLEVPDDATPEEIDAIVGAESGPAAPQRTDQSTLAGVGGMLSRGATLGFGDEISGLADAIGRKLSGDDRPIMDIYREKQQMYDTANDQFAADNPITAGALEATGATLPTAAALLTGNAAPVAQQAGGALSRIGRNVAIGANTGAAAGYGNADPGERAEGAGMGAAVGGAVGGGASGLIEGLSPMAAKLREPVRNILSYVQEMVAGKSPGAPAAATARTAAPVSQATSAQEKILQAIERDKLTPAQVADRLSEQQALGKPAGIIDVAGDNIRGVGRATVTLPGQGRQTATQALNDRADDQVARVTGDVEGGVGAAAQDTDELGRQIIDRRAAAARPAYQKAYAQGELTAPDLIEIMDQNPALAQAHNKARKLLAGASKEIDPLYNPENNQLIRWPTVEDVDLIKKGLDRRLYNNKRGANDTDEPALDKYFAGVLEGQRTRLLQAADEAAPDYASARAGFAGETALNEALESGRDFLNMDARQAARTLGEMSPDRQEMFRLGAVDSIRKRLQDTPDRVSAVRSIFGNQSKRNLLATLFRSPADLARFEQQMQSEIAMHQTRQFVTGGSQTANKLAEIEDFDLPIADSLVDIAGGNIKSGVMRMGRKVVDNTIGRVQSGITEGTRSEVADELFNFTETDRAQAFLKELEMLRQANELASKTKRATGTAASVGSSATLAPQR